MNNFFTALASKLYLCVWGMSCKRYTELSSQCLDRKLTRKEAFKVKWHHMFCLYCRRFRKQIDVVEHNCRNCSHQSDSGVAKSLTEAQKTKMQHEFNQAVQYEVSQSAPEQIK